MTRGAHFLINLLAGIESLRPTGLHAAEREQSGENQDVNGIGRATDMTLEHEKISSYRRQAPYCRKNEAGEEDQNSFSESRVPRYGLRCCNIYASGIAKLTEQLLAILPCKAERAHVGDA